jgi:serine/threonine protein kinase
MYQMLTGRLPFWRNKTLEEVSKLPPYEIVAAVRTYEVCLLLWHCSYVGWPVAAVSHAACLLLWCRHASIIDLVVFPLLPVLLQIQYPRDVWAAISPEAQHLVSCMLDRNPASRLSAEQALAHPWFTAMLGYTPTPSGDMLAANNVLEFPGAARGWGLQQQESASCPGSPTAATPVVLPLSPRTTAAAAASCMLPLARRWSSDMAAGVLEPELPLAPRPVAVPAAE